MDYSTLITAYAAPTVERFGALYEAVATGGASACLILHSELARERGNDALANFFASCMTKGMRYIDLWSPFFLRLSPASRRQLHIDGDCALLLSLFMFSNGAICSLRGDFAYPTTVPIYNRIFTHVSGYFFDRESLLVTLKTCHIRGDNTFYLNDSCRVSPVIFCGSFTDIKTVHTIRLLGANQLPYCWYAMLPLNGRGIEAAAVTDVCEKRFLEAIELLRSVEGCYEWVVDMISWIALVQSPPGMVLSGSVEALPGLIYASCDHDPLTLSETLIHEASHQRFYQLNAIRPLYDSAKTWSGWSPFMKCMRPISGLLLGFHAFVNVACFFVKIRDFLHPSMRMDLDSRIGEINRILDESESIIADCSILTNVGKEFYNRLLLARSESTL